MDLRYYQDESVMKKLPLIGKKGEEMSTEDIELQKQIDSMRTTFLCTREMTIQFEQCNARIRVKDTSQLPLLKLKQELCETEIGTTFPWPKDFLPSAGRVLEDFAKREKQNAENAWLRAWNPIRTWFNEEYETFMQDVNRWPKVRKDFYENRQRHAAKPSPANLLVLERAAEKYKAHLELINGKLGSQKDIQRHHQHCVNAHFQELLDYHKGFHRENVKIVQSLRETLENNKPGTVVRFDELPPDYVEAARQRLKSANKRPSSVEAGKPSSGEASTMSKVTADPNNNPPNIPVTTPTTSSGSVASTGATSSANTNSSAPPSTGKAGTPGTPLSAKTKNAGGQSAVSAKGKKK